MCCGGLVPGAGEAVRFQSVFGLVPVNCDVDSPVVAVPHAVVGR
jgi:hypothetical protein